MQSNSELAMTRAFAALRRVREFSMRIRMPLQQVNGQRMLGPCFGVQIPPDGCEVLVLQLPKDMFEDEIYPILLRFGPIYRMRLMLEENGLLTRRHAYVTFCNQWSAVAAIELLNRTEIRPGFVVVVEKAQENKRLFLGGIPDAKTKDQVWRELIRIGMTGILDVIMYRSYTDRNRNRGFVFVEFSTHQEAAFTRLMYQDAMIFGQRIQLYWSTPLHQVDDDIMRRVRRLFVRNMPVRHSTDDMKQMIVCILGLQFRFVEKVYKHRDYGFIHFATRRDAQKSLEILRDYFKRNDYDIEVTWAKPSVKDIHRMQIRSNNSFSLDDSFASRTSGFSECSSSFFDELSVYSVQY
ncbi:PREDICTED: APOBEC1 complementation factor-like [Nicrophorus vespilloides]|uniref:APOBEC1 complementation factor-like n=1 Tax=Nicrophorus vespilloides TaxID=110193 RepID=A0ABM1MA41_NICVS|nr:PREDICTED: APOBEC1 complementation factor-like [Nicrophorus vespilloides]